MGFRVDLDALDVMLSEANAQVGKWNQELANASVAVNALIGTDNISGVGADSVRSYLEMSHKPIIMSLSLVIRDFIDSFLVYRSDYINVDSAAENVLIIEDELEDLISQLETIQSSILTIAEQAESDVKQVNAILSDNTASVVAIKRADDVLNIHREIRQFLMHIQDSVNTLENTHSTSDFAEIDTALTEVKSQIDAFYAKPRSFIESFDPMSLENITRYNQLVEAVNPVIADLNSNAVAIENAMENYNLLMDEKARLIEERAEAAKWKKLAVTAVVLVAAVAITVALPVSGPLVAGAVSGVSSAIISANNNYQDQYVLSGDRSEINIGEVVLEGGKGFATGFVTGVVGGAANQAIGGALGKIPLTHSANYATNVVTNVVTGSVTEVTAGMLTRTTEGVLEQVMDDESGIDWDAIGEDVFDGGEIIKDAVIGGVSGWRGVNEQDFSESGNTKYEQDVMKEMQESGEWDDLGDEGWDSIEGANYDSPYTPDEKSIMKEMQESGKWNVDTDSGDKKLLDFFVKEKDTTVPKNFGQEYFGDGYHKGYRENSDGELVESVEGWIQEASHNTDKVLKDVDKIFKRSEFFEELSDYGDGYTKFDYVGVDEIVGDN